MSWDYDPENVFARILRGEIPSAPILDSEHAFAFRDISPQAPTHVLVIPKGPYVSYDHFATEASEAEIVGFTRAVAQVCQSEGVSLKDTETGHRLIANSGTYAHQEVPHFHVHILSGRAMGPLIIDA